MQGCIREENEFQEKQKMADRPRLSGRSRKSASGTGLT
jgi:hypothetical protein